MQYKLWGMNQLWITKTTKYEKALYYRLKILLHLLQYQFESNVSLLDNIVITFSKNLPTDNSAMLQMVQALKDVVSTKTLLKQIPFVEDVEAEMEELDAQAAKNADLYGFNNNAGLEDNNGEE